MVPVNSAISIIVIYGIDIYENNPNASIYLKSILVKLLEYFNLNKLNCET